MGKTLRDEVLELLAFYDDTRVKEIFSADVAATLKDILARHPSDAGQPKIAKEPLA